MNRKELTKIVIMMILNWKKSFGSDVFNKFILRFKGQELIKRRKPDPTYHLTWLYIYMQWLTSLYLTGDKI